MARAIDLTINGKAHSFIDDPDRSLLDVLRHGLGLTASRFGCGEGLCGACHVLVDGRAVTSCNRPLWSLAGKTVVTLEGLGDAGNPHPLQQALIDEQAMQCGYCISGIIISTMALLAMNPSPADHEIRAVLDGNLCRCGSHNRILRAIHRAAAMMREQAAHV
jgi:nicotinate dehydrogenase subunit A